MLRLRGLRASLDTAGDRSPDAQTNVPPLRRIPDNIAAGAPRGEKGGQSPAGVGGGGGRAGA
eukprot:5747536-Lingulodinium_polyedra.AAC.1